MELVDATGRPTGSTTAQSAHQPPGRRHRAFSVVLRDPDGRILLQRRAAGKQRFPLRWANTCCGHPAPGEEVAVAARRRLAEETGIRGIDLIEVGVYQYHAGDPATGQVEHEYDHVLLGQVPADVPSQPDPAEVAELRWVTLTGLLETLEEYPQSYAPWVGGVVTAAVGTNYL